MPEKRYYESSYEPSSCNSAVAFLSSARQSLRVLPVDAIREELKRVLREVPIVLTAPTGTGKSTQVPRWLSGRVLVIQPRRVAARAVAIRIAVLEGEEIGQTFGYRVRDEDVSGPQTRVLVVTPGIVLARPKMLEEFNTIILDEFHERRLDTDLIVALFLALSAPKRPAFIAMSATLEAERLATHLGGRHLQVEARNFPVDISYASLGAELPERRDLDRRVVAAVTALLPFDGDVLVFLPGKGEIASAAMSLGHLKCEVLELHGGLTLKAQAKALCSSDKPRVILATNVAETSLTIVGVRTVIDAGLVRRTTYHEGRSYLSLSAIALDSADQRSGRAGRTAPGKCLRLWGKQALLASHTPPEIKREPLEPVVMAAAALKLPPEKLAFLDPPEDYALKDAIDRLLSLGALREEGGIHVLSERGERLRSLPLDPWLGQILVEAERAGTIEDAVRLVAGLEQSDASRLISKVTPEELERRDCDVCAIFHALTLSSEADRGILEARASEKRLRSMLGLTAEAPTQPLDGPRRERLLKTILAAVPATAHIARRRNHKLTLAGGGTEKELGRESLVAMAEERRAPTEKGVEALLSLSSHARSSGQDRRILISVASPIPVSWIAEAGLGERRLKSAEIIKKGPDKGRLLAASELVFCGTVIASSLESPQGKLARMAIAQLFQQGRLHQSSMREAEARLGRRALAAQLGKQADGGHFKGCQEPPSLGEWIVNHLEELGVESGDDLALLGADDFLPDDVASELLPELIERFPQEVDLGDCLYRATYDLAKRQVLLAIVRGRRDKPPQGSYLPRFAGFKVFVEAGGSIHAIKR